MPTRTLVKELCDVCYADDGTETDASERLRFGWQGRNYVLLVCDQHVDEIRDDLQHWSEIASPESGGRRPLAPAAPRPVRAAAAERREAGARKTLFSQLSDPEKERFRRWADMPNARRIGDSRVEEWTAAGRP
jgi:hypothetical protein